MLARDQGISMRIRTHMIILMLQIMCIRIRTATPTTRSMCIRMGTIMRTRANKRIQISTRRMILPRRWPHSEAIDEIKMIPRYLGMRQELLGLFREPKGLSFIPRSAKAYGGRRQQRLGEPY